MAVDLHKAYIHTALKFCFGPDVLSNLELRSLLQLLAEHAEEIAAEAGDYVMQEGIDAEYLFIPTSGVMLIERASSSNFRHVYAFVFPGNLFGISSESRYPYSVKALAPVSLLRIKRTHLDQLMRTDPAVARLFYEIATRIISFLISNLYMLGQKTAVQRVCYFLLDFQRMGNFGNELFVPMTRKDIACYLGISEETVSRAFTRLKQLQLIDVKSQYFIELLDVSRLEQCCQERDIPVSN
ncbi:MAG TPA: Crp/Fnr family transcriptional regulator [Rheinheimera sp.]|nr:Crp/Fnr family transcriptional regulator [Rheinheimera sp.]